MKLLAKFPPRSYGMNMTPMIDCVFQLLVFFMCATRFSADTMEPVTLPVADQGREVEEGQDRLVVNVRQDGHVVLQKTEIGDDELARRLRHSVRGVGAEKVRLVLRVDRRAPLREVQRVLKIVAEAGVWRISYAVSEEDKDDVP